MLVENTKPKLTHLSASVMLKPGINFVEDEAWEKFAALKFVAAKLASGDLRVMEPPKAAEPPNFALPPPAKPTVSAPVAPTDADKDAAGKVDPKDPSGALSDYSAADAVKIVQATLDRALLETWVVAEKRKTVIEALEKQLDKLDPTDADKDAAAGED